MADLPHYPDSAKDAGAGPDRESTTSHPGVDDTSPDQEATTGSWASKLVISGVVALVAVIVILHLTGVVGPGAH